MSALALLTLALLCGGLQDPEDTPQGRSVYLGREVARTMHWRGAPWLLRETRENEENGKKLREWLDVAEGQVVCDLGCGNGYHTLPLAQAVGRKGAVLAVDLQPEMLELLEERAEGLGLENLVTIEATVDDPRIPPDSVDLVLMVDVYHELSHPVRVLGHVRRGLREGGRVVLVEFRAEDRAVPIKARHKMSKAQVIREMAAGGLRLCGETDDLPWQHVMAFEVAPQDPRLEARELARGFAAAAQGTDARILMPYLASIVERGTDERVPALDLARSLAVGMRSGKPPIRGPVDIELRGAGAGRLLASLCPEAGDRGRVEELLLGRDGEGRWQVQGWWRERQNRPPSFVAMHTGLGSLGAGESAALLAELGYDGVGCGLGDAAEFRAALEPLGLDVWSSYAVLDVSAKLEPQLERIREEMRALSGAPAAIWLAVREGSERMPDDAFGRSMDRIVDELGKTARDTAIEVHLYPHTGFRVATYEDARGVLAGKDEPWLGACFNLCHYLGRQDAPGPEDLFKTWGAPAVVTVNGARVGGSGWGELIMPLDEGNHDLLTFIQLCGPLECLGLQGYGISLGPREHLTRSTAVWRRVSAAIWPR